ncbi:MAG: glycosyltransferase [Acidobacteriota bacterium]|nr:glycosyltransferase [Acidobacteriota bacterium]
MSKPLVTVWCSTYNHQKYIAQAIEGFVMQKTNFEVEIYIHDDASTDNTANIVREYAARYPQIKAICQTENKFSVDKSYLNRTMFAKAQGKYIAMCEGDDYWTDPHKLQKQVEFLEANPDFSICFHAVKIIYEDENKEPDVTNKNQVETVAFEDLALKNFIHTVSCVFRNNSLEMPEWFGKISAGDYVLHLLNAQYGKIRFINEVMAVYRVHKGGFWSANNFVDLYEKWIPIIKECRKHFYPKGKEQFTNQLTKSYEQLCFAYFEANRYKDLRQNFPACVLLARHIKGRAFLALTIRYLLSHAPGLADLYKKTLTSSKPMLDGTN